MLFCLHYSKTFIVVVTEVTWSNIFLDLTVDDNFRFINVLVMLLVDTLLYGIIAWYVEAIRPGKFGIPRMWYFPFQVRHLSQSARNTSKNELQRRLQIGFAHNIICKGLKMS